MRSTLLGFIFILFVQPLWGQNNSSEIYEDWNLFASQAEVILANDTSSSLSLEELRVELSRSRSVFLNLREQGGTRLTSLKAQLTALGPEASDGEDESSEITERRKELKLQIKLEQAPSREAAEAFERANGLIAEVDEIIRARQAAQLFELRVSPLNPSLIMNSVKDLRASLSSIKTEVSEARSSASQNILQLLMWFFIATLLIWQGTLRIKKTLNSIFSSDNEWQLMVKSRLNQLLPFASTILAATSIYYGLKLILLGPSGTTLVCGLYMVIALGLAGRWLSKVIFSGDELNEPLFKMADNNADTAVNNVGLLGWVLGTFFLFKNLFALNSNENNFILAPNFLLIIIASVALFRFAGIANKFEQNRGLDGDLSFRQMSLRFLARIIKLISIVGPIIAAIGYYEASIALVYPIIETLLALGVVLIAHTYASELLNITLSRDEGENTLTAGFLRTLIGIILICIAIPCIALFWGARTTDLTEFWNWLQNGFQFGDARLTPTNLITFVVIFVLGYMITKLIQRGLKDSILPNTRLDAGGKNAVLAVTSYFGIFVVAMIAITAAGIDLSGLAIVAGALSVGIGFGLQAIVSNFVSGIILLIERPIKQGDWVEVGGYSGYVRSINVRSTMIDTFDRATVIVPNSDLIAGTVTNWTHNSDNGRVIVPVGVAYGSDPRRVEEVLREIAESHPRILPGSTPSVVFKQFGADSMDFEIRVILTDVNYLLSVKSEMNYEIFKRFKEEGIEIPFAQRDIHLRDIDKLTDALSGKSKK